MDCLIVGCGLSGAVVARELAEHGLCVEVWERRNHIGGNMYDYCDEHGILVQKYGPHTFHTKERSLFDYMCQFADWQEYRLTCGAVWANTYTPTPFNFTTIDSFFPPEEAFKLKEKLCTAFPKRAIATVTEVLAHPDSDIRGYAEFLFKNDYAPYTAKQWGVSPEEIDASVLRRVPLRFSYDEGYFDDSYQVMPTVSFTHFFKKLLDHPNIQIKLNCEALTHLAVSSSGTELLLDGKSVYFPIVYTGALDELFHGVVGALPYRSLRFDWYHEDIESKQPAPVVAYPQEEGYTRITEYKKLPVQQVEGTTYVLEYPSPHRPYEGTEPYYPVLTEASQQQHEAYSHLAEAIPNLYCCGRLADFKYYNMDEALKRALSIVKHIKKYLG